LRDKHINPTQAADYWIHKLGLIPHPEGGWYRETYRSNENIVQSALPVRYNGPRSFCTLIYFLLENGQVSHLHRLQSDEQWHFYAGSSLTIHVIDPQGHYCQQQLGSDPEKNEVFQRVIPAGCWFGATVDDPEAFSLIGCVVAPGFEFNDFELGKRGELLAKYPDHAAIIGMLT
jgi:predicted cupin superfamily sugar epimerase